MAPKFLRRLRIPRRIPVAEIARELDPATLTLLDEGRETFRRMLPEGTRVMDALDADSETIRGLVFAAAHATEPAAALGIVVVNRKAAALEHLDIGCTADALRGFAEQAGLDVVEPYGIGYIPNALARGARDLDELQGNGGVFASPDDCVLLAFHCRVPIDERS